jgi:hypothetical protein
MRAQTTISFVVRSGESGEGTGDRHVADPGIDDLSCVRLNDGTASGFVPGKVATSLSSDRGQERRYRVYPPHAYQSLSGQNGPSDGFDIDPKRDDN